MLFHAHSGLRYVVLLAAIVALWLATRGRLGGKPYGGAARTSGAVFVALLDLQVLLGLVLLALWNFYPQLIGHIVMMVLAAVAAHGFRVAIKRAADDATRYTRAILAVAVPLLFVIGGILAIQRPIL